MEHFYAAIIYSKNNLNQKSFSNNNLQEVYQNSHKSFFEHLLLFSLVLLFGHILSAHVMRHAVCFDVHSLTNTIIPASSCGGSGVGKSLWFTLTYLLTKILKSVKSSFQNVFVCSIGTLIFLNRSELLKNGSKCLRRGLINWEMTEMRFYLLKYALTESFATTAEAETNLNIFRKSRDDTVSIDSKKLKMLQFSQGRASKDQNQIMLGIQHLRTDSDRTVSRSRVSMTIKTATVIFVLTSCWCFHDGDSSRCSCDHLQRP